MVVIRVALEHDDITELKKVFDDRYVLQSDCNEKQEKVNKKFSNDDKRIELISHDFDVIKKLMWAVATSSIGALVVAVFELILK
jgi:hypothetical protein